MRLSTVCMRTACIMLVGNTIALAPPAATSTGSFPQRLEVRQPASDFAEVRSGTLTVTVAPDATCAYDDLDDPVLVCDEGRPCTWEQSKYARVFCGWASLRTTCLDSSQYSDTKYCDDKCRSDKLMHPCTSSAAPYCVRMRFKNGIIHYTCHSTRVASSTIYTAPSLEEREFSTIVLVDRKPIETTSTKSVETTSTGPPKTDPPVGAIVGGVVGGVAVVGLISLGVFGLLILRRRRRRRRSGNKATSSPAPASPVPPVQEQLHMPNKKAASASSNPLELDG